MNEPKSHSCTQWIGANVWMLFAFCAFSFIKMEIDADSICRYILYGVPHHHTDYEIDSFCASDVFNWKKNARTLCTISWVSRLLLAINHTQFFCRMHRHSKQKYVVAWLIFQYRTACTPWARWLHSVLVFWLAFFVLAALFPLACCCTNAYLYGEPRSNCGDDVHDLS